MENSKTEKKERVFVNFNQTWQKAKITEKISENNVKVELNSGKTLEIKIDSNYIEKLNSPGQKYALADVKQKLEGEYISFEKLPTSVKQSISEGKEYLHSTLNTNGKEIVKLVQMKYSKRFGSILNVELKRNKELTLESAEAFNYKFSNEEFEKMKNNNEVICFEGCSTDGEVFKKFAFYDKRINSIRTKSLLNKKAYFLGKSLTDEEVDKLNNKERIEVVRNTKNGIKTYNISYNPRSENFNNHALTQEQSKSIGIVSEEVVKTQKKKSQANQNSVSV